MMKRMGGCSYHLDHVHPVLRVLLRAAGKQLGCHGSRLREHA